MAERRLQVLPSRSGAVGGAGDGHGFRVRVDAVHRPHPRRVLTIAGDGATVGRGVVLLTAYSLGLAVPFVASSIALRHLSRAFGAFRRHARVVNVVSGVVLAAFGVVLFLNRVGWLAARTIDVMQALGLKRLTQI